MAKREGALEPLKGLGDGLLRGPFPWLRYWVIRCTTTSVSVSEARFRPAATSFVAQLEEVLDDAVVDHHAFSPWHEGAR